MDKLKFIAMVRYYGWLCYQLGAGLPLHDVDNQFSISEDRLNSLINGTKWALENPEATPEDNHINWMNYKQRQGWVYGEKLDMEDKTHPSLVPFKDLPDVEKRKDEMDILMVKLGERLYNELKLESDTR